MTSTNIEGSTNTFNYPQVRRDDINEQIFGTTVADPYRWLEDPKSEETNQFITSQNEITLPYLKRFPHRHELLKILLENQDYKKIGCPFKRGDKYYVFINSGLQLQPVLYQQDTIDSEPRVFFDPNLLSEDGTTSIEQVSFSPDNQYFAYALSHKGSDWKDIYVRNVETGVDLPDKLAKVKFCQIEWTHDNKGFFYAQFPNNQDEGDGTSTCVLENHSVYYHVLNTSQSDDSIKVEFPEHPKWLIGFEVSQDGKYLHIFPTDGCINQRWYFSEITGPITNEKLDIKPIYELMDSSFDYVASNGKTVYFRTNLDAENYRIAELNLDNPSKDNWKDVVACHPNDVLTYAEVYTVDGKDYILLMFMRKVAYYLELHELGGKLIKKFDTPLGTISKTSGRREDGELFYQFTSLLTPGDIYHYDLRNLNSNPRLLLQAKPKNFQPDDYEIKQVFYKSKDQTEVPMFIVHKKGLSMTGQNPCILYGYGGFNINLLPSFDINRLSWLSNFQGIFALANIRGGGEFGKRWHESGCLLNKQNVFDDFIAAAEYLIDNKYTNTNLLAIEGGSNGGLLVAAVANQRPDLIGAVLCHVGVHDMIRYTSFTIGHAWATEFGDPKEEEQFKNLIKFSPYHNIPSSTGRYPATLLLTADHDDRVVPAHSYKFIAQLQHELGQKLPNTPLLIRIDTNSGHGSGKPLSKIVNQYLDIYSFLYSSLSLEEYFVLQPLDTLHEQNRLTNRFFKQPISRCLTLLRKIIK